MRTLWQFLSPDKGKLALALLFYAIKHSPVFIMPVILGNVVNILSDTPHHRPWELAVNLIVAGVMYAQNVATGSAFMSFFSRASRGVEARLRSSLFRQLQQLSISYHRSKQSGRLQAKMLRDVEAVERMNSQVINVVWPGVLGLVYGLTLALTKQRMIALFFLGAIPLAGLLRWAFLRHLETRNRHYRRNIEAMSGMIGEMIQMIPIARAHAVEDQEISRLDSAVEEVRHRGYRLDVLNTMFGASVWVTFAMFRLLCLGFTGYMAYHGKIDVGSIIMYQGVFEIILGAVNGMLGSYSLITMGMESMRSIGEVLQCPDIEVNVGKSPVTSVRGDYVFEDVSFAYPGSNRPALENFSLHVSAGESIAMVGESGAGKTTLVNLLVGFNRPTRGQIRLDGVDMQDLDLRTYRRHLAVVPQNTLLFSGTVRENIVYGLSDVSDRQLWQAIEAANAADFIRKLPSGLATRIGEHGAKLSGGQRQRVAIARALVRDPRVIILDEATSALDVISEKQVQEALGRLIAGRTTFIVAHRLSTIRRCSRIVVMRAGRCVEIGSHDDLMARPSEFSRLKTLQT